MRLGSWKSQIGLAVMVVISTPAFATLTKGDISSANATDPSTRSCSKDANKITFNVDGNKDYYVGRDVETNGDGWYFNAQGGEIVRVDPNNPDQMCMQTGMRINTGTKADADNKLGPPKCGPAISGTREVQGLDGSVKEYQWQWHPKSGSSEGYLTITPMVNGNFGTPVLKISGSRSKADGKNKARSGISVDVEDMQRTGTSEKQGKNFSIDMSGEVAGAQPRQEKTCVLGRLDSNSQQASNISWDPDKGVMRQDGDTDPKPAVQVTASAANR